MKSVLVVVLAVLAIGCSSTPSNKELNARMDAQGRTISTNNAAIIKNTKAIEDQNKKIDRMFEKSQYK